jgi:hypothetical protein
MGWISHSSTYCQMCVGSYGYIPSCQAPKATVSQGPKRAMLIRCCSHENLITYMKLDITLSRKVNTDDFLFKATKANRTATN